MQSREFDQEHPELGGWVEVEREDGTVSYIYWPSAEEVEEQLKAARAIIRGLGVSGPKEELTDDEIRRFFDEHSSG